MNCMLKHHFPIICFLFIFFTTLYFASTVGGMNSIDGSQYALTQAIAEEKTFRIDSFMQWTYYNDYAIYNNHYYSDREPGISFLTTPFYLIGKIVLDHANPIYGNYKNMVKTAYRVDRNSTLQALTYLSSAWWGAIGVVTLYLLCIQLKTSKTAALITSFIMGLGSLHWKYSAGFMREPIFTTFLLLTLLFLFQSTFRPRSKLNKYYLILSGIFMGTSLFVDYTKLYLIPFLLIFLFFKNRHKKFLNSLLFYSIGIVPILLIIFLYNFISFRNPFTIPHLYKGSIQWMNNIKNNFQIPLIPGIFTNLFSFKPIKPALLKYFWDNPQIGDQMYAKGATKTIYKGIFVQSPILFFALLGWLFFFRKYAPEATLIIICGFLILLVNSKLSIFWAVAQYDSRYFLPVSILLLLGLPFSFEFMMKSSNLLKHLLIIVFFILTVLSVFNGWNSNLNNAAPHATNIQKFSLQDLIYPVFTKEHFMTNLTLLFINTFPNIFNIHLLIIYYFFPLTIIYFICKIVKDYEP